MNGYSSRGMLQVVREASPQVEYYSIDEFFFSVDAPAPQAFAESIRGEILARLAVPVTVGVARTRTLAKLVSDLAKPFGALALIGQEAEEELLASRPAADVTGIGSRRSETLAKHGIKTCLDFARARPLLVRSLLTVVGEKLGYELRGVKAFPIQTTRPPHKVISRGGSIGQATPNPDVQWAWAIRNLERLIEALEHHGLVTRKLTLHVEYKHGPGMSADANLIAPTDRFDLLLEAVQYLWPRVLLCGASLSRMHYFAGDLQQRGNAQLGLFDTPATVDTAMKRLKRESGAKHGRFAIRSAATLPLVEIYQDDAHSYEICDVYGKTCF